MSTMMVYARKNDDGSRFQTLENHSRNVALHAESYSASFDMKLLAKLIGLIHDYGKNPEPWQNYLINGGKTVYHAIGAVKFVEKHFPDSSSLAPYVKMIIGLVCWGHHSGLRDCVSLDGKHCYYSDFKRESDMVELPNLPDWENEQELQNLFVASFDEVKTIGKVISLNAQRLVQKQNVYNYCQFQYGLLIKMLLSSLVDADRLDAAMWNENKTSCSDCIPDWSMLSAKLNAYLEAKGSSPINKIRKDISFQCYQAASRENGVYELLVPTGGGKTLSSLRFAIEHARKEKCKHIFYIIPYTTILDQTSQVVKDALGNDVVLEHYSTIVQAIEQKDEDDEDNSWAFERWEKPIIMTTQVQFFNAFFSGKNSDLRRLHQLCESVIIFDEVQTVPVKLLDMFSNCVSFLSSCGHSTILFCSATVPSYEKLPYKINFSSCPSLIQDTKRLFSSLERTKIVDVRSSINKTNVAEFVVQKNIQDSVLVILNTKNAVRTLYQEIKELAPDRKVFHLSTTMYPAHRKRIIEKIRKFLPKEKIIVVSTNLIEAGIDISFGCVVRSMAGMDSIAQAAGRCNRNGETRRKEVYVIDYQEKGIESIGNLSYGQDCSKRIFDENMGLDCSFLSPEIIKRYYDLFFTKTNKYMDYPFQVTDIKTETDMMDVMGSNTGACNMAVHEEGKDKSKLLFCQSFASASKEFKVINKNAIGVIVSCEESLKLMTQIQQKSEMYGIIRKLQNYTVDVFEDQLNHLYQIGAITDHEVFGQKFYILNGNFYSEEIGINFEGSWTADDFLL
jgi:CRISPR-associated endonuclease/helicase Cas3